MIHHDTPRYTTIHHDTPRYTTIHTPFSDTVVELWISSYRVSRAMPALGDSVGNSANFRTCRGQMQRNRARCNVETMPSTKCIYIYIISILIINMYSMISFPTSHFKPGTKVRPSHMATLRRCWNAKRPMNLGTTLAPHRFVSQMVLFENQLPNKVS
jgi:hypothetical protein